MRHLGAIQALRAIAALMVVFGHLQSEALLLPASVQYGFAPVLLDLTGAGVDLFFVISGFVMVFASRGLFAQPHGTRRFLARRVARIVPLYWMVTTLFLLTLFLAPKALSSEVPTWSEIVQSYVFIPYAHPGSDSLQPVYKLGWTLNYEMFFYLIFAGCLFLPMRKAVMTVVCVLAGLAGLGLWLMPPGVLAFWVHPIILEFGFGAVLALLRIQGVGLRPLVCALLAVAGVCGFAASGFYGVSAHGVWRPLVWGVPAALIIASAALGEGQLAGGRFSRVLLLLGDASYSLYLAHPIILRVFHLAWNHIGASASLNPWIFVGLGLCLITLAAVLIHKWLEKPMTELAQAWLVAGRGDRAEALKAVG